VNLTIKGKEISPIKKKIEYQYEEEKAQNPHDLLKYDISQLKLLCKENKILQTGDDALIIIGKLLHLFPKTAVTEKDLHRFTADQLRSISDGLNISREGDIEELAKRILKYHHTVLVHYKAPEKKRENLNKLITKRRFHRFVPAIPVTVCDKLYKAEPHKSSSEPYSWRGKETQEVLIGDNTYNATVEFNITLEKITNQKDSSRD